MINELFQLAINNMLRARARLMMTAGGVLVGTAAVILLIALTIGLQASAEADIGNDPYMLQMQVSSNRFNWRTGTENEDARTLSPQTVNSFWRIPGVRAVLAGIRLNNGSLRVGTTQGWGDMIGIDPAVLPYMGLRTQKGELSLNRGEVLVGMDVGNNFYDPNAEEYQEIRYDLMNEEVILAFVEYTDIGEQIIDEIPLKIVGVLDNSNDFNYRVIFNVEDVHEYNAITGTVFDPETFVHDDVTVYATGRDTVEDVFNTLKEMGFQVYGSIEYFQSLNGFFASMRMMLGGIGGVALLVAAFGVANTMTMAILERTREIGLMKAVGARDQDVLMIFLIEAGLVGLVGGLAGVTVALILQQLVNEAVMASSGQGDDSGYNFLPINTDNLTDGIIVIPTELIVFGLILATLVGIFAGVYPALRAARMSPVEALKTD